MTGVCLAASQKTCVWEFGVTPYLQNCSSVWSSEHMHSVSGRREPAGWQKNTIGIAHVLVLTMSQAALPDGEFEWSQLWVIEKKKSSFLCLVLSGSYCLDVVLISWSAKPDCSFEELSQVSHLRGGSIHIISHCVHALSAVMDALLCCWICKFCVAMCASVFPLGALRPGSLSKISLWQESQLRSCFPTQWYHSPAICNMQSSGRNKR